MLAAPASPGTNVTTKAAMTARARRTVARARAVNRRGFEARAALFGGRGELGIDSRAVCWAGKDGSSAPASRAAREKLTRPERERHRRGRLAKDPAMAGNDEAVSGRHTDH